jgi:CIC family chloride channel protein
MGTLYGGIAHAPVSSLVMVCELAGSYDLLVPLMLAEGIAFVALRKHSLYHAQLPSQRDSPAHPARLLDVLKAIPIQQVITRGRPFAVFSPATPASEMLRAVAGYEWQDVFPVLDRTGKMTGIVTAETLRIMASEPDLAPLAVANDAMQPPVALCEGDGLRTAIEVLSANGLREVPVVDGAGKIVGFVDEADIGRAYLEATAKLGRPADATPISPEGSDATTIAAER